MSQPPPYTAMPGATSPDPMGIYDADTSSDGSEVMGEQREQSDLEELSDGEQNVEKEGDQTRICTVCFNLKLFVDPIDDSSPAPPPTSSRFVLYEEVLRDNIKSKCLVKLEFYELLESARLGYCPYCQFVFDCLRSEDAEPDESKSTIIRIIARPRLPFYLYWHDKNRGPRGVQVYAEKGTSPCVPELGFATELAPRAFGDQAFSQIRGWLQDCETNHPDCPRSSFPPRRLIDVGIPTPPSGARVVRLIQDRDEPVKYIALSHCWGTEQNFTTTKATFDARMAEIAWNALPKTYRDAIKVARRLHIRYIWIDSLCIIQDDEDDWDIESAKMSSIYENSYFTLAAALSPGDTHGFLGLDDDRLVYASSQVQGVKTTRIRNIHDYRTLPSEDILATRAWIMQERIIPQRLLTFSLGITFQCRQADWCECGSSLFPDLLSTEPDTWRRLDRAILRAAFENEDDPSALYHFWLNAIVVPYSSKKLTRMSDRLPAVSALAQKFQMKLDEKYFAGLWEKDLICGLSWTTDNTKTEGTHRNMSDRAPSWSWASVEGSVKLGFINQTNDRTRRPNLRLQFGECIVNYRGFNTTGEVDSGTLNAHGPFLPCFLTLGGQEQGATYEFIPLLGALEYAVISSRLGDDSLLLDTALQEVEIPEDDGSSTSSLQRCKYDNQEAVGGAVVCLLLYQLRQNDSFIREFLVLGRDPLGSTNFKRIGMLVLWSGESPPPWFGELPEAWYAID